MEHEWLYRFKRKIIAGLVLLLLLSTLFSLASITVLTRNYLLESSARNTRELASSIGSSLSSLMLRRSTAEIQETISQLGKNEHIARILILNRTGQIAFSSVEAENGRQLAKEDESCRGCHNRLGTPPATTTMVFSRNGEDVQRNVTVIHNAPGCYGCHPPTQRINGKLIIDCSLAATYDLIGRIRFLILASGALCIVVIFLAIPYLSRSIDRYIDQVVYKSNEINMIYHILESVSKSIDLENLKRITLDIVASSFATEQVNLVLPLRDREWRIINRADLLSGERRIREPDSFLDSAITRWQAGNLTQTKVLAENTIAYLPIAKGGIPLALIEIRSPDTPFPPEKMKFMESVINPIAIAFENARLYSMAITDELTGLYTVRHFRNCLDRQRDLYDSHGEKFVLLLLDIDNFKMVNDNYGHPAGDAVLKRVARSIAEAVRESDFVFRYGGEEFTVLLPHTVGGGGLQVAERIRATVEARETDLAGVVVKTTVSVGMALFPENATNVRDLVQQADAALYRAKRSGKNRVVGSERSSEYGTM
jgi:diguanylate cyclase (GGDEF)-like protein